MAQAHPVTAARSYPISVEVAYKLEHQRTLRTGSGWTQNMSSTHIEFFAAEALPRDSRIDLSITWPVLLNGKVGLRLCIQGKIIESRGTCTAAADIPPSVTCVL